jgi:hypothetical protein
VLVPANTTSKNKKLYKNFERVEERIEERLCYYDSFSVTPQPPKYRHVRRFWRLAVLR